MTKGKNVQLKRTGFLKAYATCGNITAAARACDIHRNLHYNTWLKDPEYVEAFKDAGDEAIETLEAEARRRAHDGLVRYKFDKNGDPIRHPETGEPYYELQYSDTLLIFLLKALRPKVYREKVEHTGPDGGPITIEHLAPMRRDDG